MNARKLFTSVLILGAMTSLAGCGRNLTGTYSMTQGLSGGITSGNCANSQLTFNITDNGGVTGNASSACYIENLTGSDQNGQITGVTLTLTPLNNGFSNGGSYNQTCTYTGTLSSNGNQINGTLTLMGQAQTQGQQSYSYCATAISISGTKTN